MAAVAILVDGVDVTDDVVLSGAKFESQVNGAPGRAEFRLRGGSVPVAGQDVQLRIDGDVVWRGFVSVVRRTYAFPAAVGTGLLNVEAVDLNILFKRRFVFDQATPTNMLAPLYGPHTDDSTALADLFSDWLDLSGDGLDTTTYVETVGETTDAQEGRAWRGSDEWGQAMQSIAALPGAIWYIRPNPDGDAATKGYVVYTDVNTPTAAFGLSDQPNGTTTRGYREMEVLNDGANLANDVLCWGAGFGSADPVFKRLQDETSQSTHGLWQFGQVTPGVFRQGTIDRIADSILNGSPSNKRGAKDDRVSVSCVVYEPGLFASDKVAFESVVFGFSDVIPVRRMTITFESPTAPRYALVLSHEIDSPFGFFDNIDFTLPPFPRPRPPKPVFPPPPGDCECGITDTFTRSLGPFTHTGWDDSLDVSIGISDAGIEWEEVVGAIFGSGEIEVTGSTLRFHTEPQDAATPDDTVMFQNLPITHSDTFTVRCRFRVNEMDTTHGGVGTIPQFFDFWMIENGFSPEGNSVGFDLGSDKQVRLWSGTSVGFNTEPFELETGVWYRLLWENDAAANLQQAKVWKESDPEPVAYTIAHGNSAQPSYTVGYFQFAIGSGRDDDFDALDVEFDDLDIDGVDRCSEYRFDNFDRSVTSGWGIGDAGQTWIAHGPGGGQFKVEDGFGKVIQSGAGSQFGDVGVYTTEASEQWSGDFSMIARFRVDRRPTADWGGEVLVGLRDADLSGFTVDQGWGLRFSAGTTHTEYPVGVDNVRVIGDWDDSLFIMQHTPHQVVSVPYAWSEGATYLARYEREGTTVRVRVWLDGATEPTGWDVEVTGDAAFTPDRFRVTQSATTRNLTAEPYIGVEMWWDYIDFDYVGRPCYDGGPVPGSGGMATNPWGYGCEVAERVSSTAYATSFPFVAGSTRVKVDGIFQRPGIAREYTEDLGHEGITFNDPVSADSEVIVCYYREDLP